MSLAPRRPRQPNGRLLNGYVGVVVLTGASLVAYGLPHAAFASPLLFVCLLLASMIAAVMKIHLPLSS